MSAVGLHDNFFDLGGSSLQVMAVHAELARRIGPAIDVVTLFRFPTIAGLAAHLSQAKPGGCGDAARDRAAQQAAALRRMRDSRARRPQ
jgi:aryl carrier-like protein